MRNLFLCLLLVLPTLVGCSDPGRPSITLYLALQRGDIDQIERHIFWKTDINEIGPNGLTPLHVAAESGQQIIIKLLIKHGADINGKDSEGNSPLYTAIMSGRTHAAELLVKNGAEFNPDLLLEQSVRNNIADRDVLRYLLLKGANINHVTRAGLTPLLEAIKQGNRVLVKHLIANGADVNQANDSGVTPLQLANQIKDDSIIRLLTTNGAASQ